MAFGIKVKKVQMMRGNRQGNNAFLEDSKHEFLTPAQYLLENDYCMNKIFRGDNVEGRTLGVIKECLGEERFEKFVERALPDIMRYGAYQALQAFFTLQGHFN